MKAYLVTNNAYDCVYVPDTGAMLIIDNHGFRADTWPNFFAVDCGEFADWCGGPDGDTEPDLDPYDIGDVIAIRDDSEPSAEIVDHALLVDRAEFHGYETADYIMTADYNGNTYTGTGEDFNAAWEAIRSQLPAGKAGDIVDIDDDGCVGGTLRWADETGWTYYP